jgi:ribosomal-protein-serine acetyltransferase
MNKNTDIVIDSTLELRVRQIEDAAAIFALVDRNRNYLRERLPWVDSTKSVKDTEGYIQSCLNASPIIDFGIWYDNQWVGSIGFHQIDQTNKKADIGYWLAEIFTRKGIVSRSVEALINYGFAELKLNQLTITVAPENIRSLGIPKSLGFVKERVLRQSELVNGKYLDGVVYSMLKSEWKK